MAKLSPPCAEPLPRQLDSLSAAYELIASSDVAWIWTIDPRSGRLNIYGDVSRLLGADIDRLDDLLPLVHPSDVDQVRDSLTRAMKDGVAGDFTARMWGADGQLVHFQVTFRTEPHPDGGFRVHGISHNVTASVEAQEALQAENQLAVKAESLAGVGYWRLDLETGQYTWSAEMYRLYDLDPADGPPKMAVMATHYCHPDDRERLRHHRESMADVAGAQINVRIVRPSGEVRHVLVRSVPERNEAGEIVARFGTLTDLTEIKQVEAAARESEQRYRFLADNVPDMILRVVLPHGIKYVSPGSAWVFGYTPEEQLRLSPQDLIHPDDAPEVSRVINELIASRRPRLEEPLVYRARHKNGEWIWIESNPTLIFDDEGTPIETIDIVRNVTQTKQVEAELEEARRRAEAVAAAKAAFLANMSHELRTPLTSIIGFSRLMGERMDLPTEAKHYAKHISDASEALLAIINDVLDFSKLEAGKVALEIEPLAVRRLVDETTGLIAIQAAAKGLEVKTELDPKTPGLIAGDMARLRQVLLNFLSNAVKFTETGGLTVKTAWRQTRTGGRLKVSVIDTGAGITPEGRSLLFERFSQAEVSIHRLHGGTGLGLAISKALIELMGGKIGVETEVGKGSNFWFEIPARAAAEAASAAEVGLEFGRQGLRILMVDDTAVNRELVKLILGAAGFEIEEACGGAEGVQAAMTKPFDLILMDLRMPGVDGLEAARRIRAASAVNSKTPILALTADVQPQVAAACRSAGMNDILAKPIAPQQLLSKIVQWGGGPARESTPRDHRSRGVSAQLLD